MSDGEILAAGKVMARGFESKAVESQQAEGREVRKTRGNESDYAERRELEQKRAGLETSRRRIARELENASSGTHRAALKNALDYLDGEIRKLG
jgi:hypothetical protein